MKCTKHPPKKATMILKKNSYDFALCEACAEQAKIKKELLIPIAKDKR